MEWGGDKASSAYIHQQLSTDLHWRNLKYGVNSKLNQSSSFLSRLYCLKSNNLFVEEYPEILSQAIMSFGSLEAFAILLVDVHEIRFNFLKFHTKTLKYIKLREKIIGKASYTEKRPTGLAQSTYIYINYFPMIMHFYVTKFANFSL